MEEGGGGERDIIHHTPQYDRTIQKMPNKRDYRWGGGQIYIYIHTHTPQYVGGGRGYEREISNTSHATIRVCVCRGGGGVREISNTSHATIRPEQSRKYRSRQTGGFGWGRGERETERETETEKEGGDVLVLGDGGKEGGKGVTETGTQTDR